MHCSSDTADVIAGIGRLESLLGRSIWESQEVPEGEWEEDHQ